MYLFSLICIYFYIYEKYRLAQLLMNYFYIFMQFGISMPVFFFVLHFKLERTKGIISLYLGLAECKHLKRYLLI